MPLPLSIQMPLASHLAKDKPLSVPREPWVMRVGLAKPAPSSVVPNAAAISLIPCPEKPLPTERVRPPTLKKPPVPLRHSHSLPHLCLFQLRLSHQGLRKLGGDYAGGLGGWDQGVE